MPGNTHRDRPGGAGGRTHAGDADIARVAALFSEPTRARVLRALADGRALPASVLASEAGVSAQAISLHLGKLLDAGLVAVEPSGRYRYYRLAGTEVAQAVESLARLAPSEPVRSLRQGTRARALRHARFCYDHLAGELGVTVTSALITRGVLVREDDVTAPRRRPGDRLAARMPDHPYRLGATAGETLAEIGVDLDGLLSSGSRRPLLRFCVDWSEQQHHLAGRLGAAVSAALTERGWIQRLDHHRAVRVTDTGARHLSAFGCAGPALSAA